MNCIRHSVENDNQINLSKRHFVFVVCRNIVKWFNRITIEYHAKMHLFWSSCILIFFTPRYYTSSFSTIVSCILVWYYTFIIHSHASGTTIPCILVWRYAIIHLLFVLWYHPSSFGIILLYMFIDIMVLWYHVSSFGVMVLCIFVWYYGIIDLPLLL